MADGWDVVGEAPRKKPQGANSWDVVDEKPHPRPSSLGRVDSVSATPERGYFSTLIHSLGDAATTIAGGNEGSYQRPLIARVDDALGTVAGGLIPDAFDRGVHQGERVFNDVLTGPSEESRRISRVAGANLQRQAERVAAPKRVEDATRAMSQAHSVGEFIHAATPAAIGDVVLSSMGQQLPALATQAINPAAGVLASGGMSYRGEVTGATDDALGNLGVDLTDPMQIADAYAHHPQAMADAQAKGELRGSVIAPLDMLTAGLAGRFFPKAPVRRFITDAALGITGGMAGEAGAQEATDGRITSLGDVLTEGIAEVPTTVIEGAETAMHARHAPAAVGAPVTPDAHHAAPPITVTPEQLGAAAVPPAAPRAPAAAPQPADAELDALLTRNIPAEPKAPAPVLDTDRINSMLGDLVATNPDAAAAIAQIVAPTAAPAPAEVAQPSAQVAGSGLGDGAFNAPAAASPAPAPASSLPASDAAAPSVPATTAPVSRAAAAGPQGGEGAVASAGSDVGDTDSRPVNSDSGAKAEDDKPDPPLDIRYGKRNRQAPTREQLAARDAELRAHYAPAELTEAAPQDDASHADPGEAPEPVTPEVVAESVQKSADATPRTLKQSRDWLLGEIDRATAAASDVQPMANVSEAQFRKLPREQQAALNANRQQVDAAGYVTFDVPGDGKFKVRNIKSHLADFRGKVEKSPGFKSTPIKPPAVASGGMTRADEKNYGTTVDTLEGIKSREGIDKALDYADKLVQRHTNKSDAVPRAAEAWAMVERRRQKAATPPSEPAPAEPAAMPTAGDTAAASAPAEPTKTAAKPTDKIEDFGETLHGARKHYAQAYADRVSEAAGLDVAVHPLSKTWPEPDYAKLLEGGTDPFVVAWVRAARDEIPNKPGKSWKLKGWAANVELLREFSNKLLGGDITRERLETALADERFARVRENVGGRADLYREVGHDVSLKGVTLKHHHYALYNGEKNVKKWAVEREAKATAYSNWPDELGVGDTREEAIDAFRRNIGKLAPKAAEKKSISFAIYSRRGTDGFIIGKKIGAKYLDLETFPTVKEARAYLDGNLDALEAKLKRETTIPEERRASNEPRVGADHRNGADVKPAQFAETFGFRGVQFGNYVEGPRRQQDLNDAYDALMDMAGVLGVPPRALSLDGTLGLAFGARGKGGARAAAAHYEPDTVVINLTKGSGAGSLAHEWWHGLDNYFGLKREASGKYARADMYLTETAAARGAHHGGVRPEVMAAFEGIAKVVRETGIRERSEHLDGRRTKPYWSTGREMTARAFESYIIARLADQGAANDYLANIVSEDAFAMERGYPYPTAAEIPAVRAAYDQFFDVVQTRETERGLALENLDESNDDFTYDPLVADRADDWLQQAAADQSAAEGEADAKRLGLDTAVAGMLKGADGAPRVEFMRGYEALPKRLRDGIQKRAVQRGSDSKVRVAALYDTETGRVFVFTDIVRTPESAMWQVAHEIAGHHGLRTLLGDALNPALEAAATNPTVSALADAIGRERRSGNRLLMIEEALAELAAATRTGDFDKIASRYGVDVPSGMRASVTSVIGDFLRRLRALFRRAGVTMKDTEVRELLEAAWQAARGDGETAATPPEDGAVESTDLIDDHGSTPANALEVREALSRGDAVFLDGERITDREALRSVAPSRLSIVPKWRMDDGGMESVDYTPEQAEFMRKAGIAPSDARTSLQRARDWITGKKPDRDSLIQSGLDQFHGLKRAINEKGGVAPEQNAYLLARQINMASTMEAVLRFGAPKLEGGALRVDRSVPGLLDALKPVHDRMPQFLGWMVARRAELLKKQGRENLMSGDDIAAGLSLADGHEADFKAAALGYLKLKNAILDLAEQTGTIDPVARAAWDHAEYIPFYRDGEGSTGPGTRQGLANQSAGVRTLKGGEAELRDPLSNIVQNFTRLIDSAMKNHATLTAVDTLGAPYFRPAAMTVKPEAIPLDQVRKHLLATGADPAAVAAMPTAAVKGVGRMLAIKAPEGDDIVRVMRDGKAEYYHVDDPLLLRSLTAFNEAPTHLLVKFLQWQKNLLTAGATATGDFLIANAIRDTGEATATAQDRFIPVWDTLRGAVESFRETPLTQDLMMAGSAFHAGLFHNGDTDATAKALRRTLREHGKDEAFIERYIKTLVNPKRLWSAYRNVAEATEMGSRVSLARKRLDAGAPFIEAAHEAKDFLDFQMRGDDRVVQTFLKIIPFLNARAQGAYRLARVGTTKGRRGKLAANLALMALASAALMLWNQRDYGDGWDDLEDWDKDANWHFMPGTAYHVRIPKPFELGYVGGTLPERMYAALRYQLTDGREGDRPGQSLDSVLHLLTGTLAVNPIPQGVKPIVEDQANKDFYFDSPIESRGDEYKAPSDRYSPNGTLVMRKASKGMAAVVGEDNAVSPKRLEHLWRGYTAGMGQYALRSADWLLRTATDAPERPAMALRDFPIVGRFAPGDTPAKTTRYVDEFYDLADQADMQSALVKKAVEAGDEKRAARLEAEYGWLLGEREAAKRAKGGFMHAGVRELARMRKELSALRKADAEVYESRSMSPDDKRTALDTNAAARNALVKKTVRQLREKQRR